LREVLYASESIAMLGEVLSLSPSAAHWDNFCRGQAVRTVDPASFGEATALLDRYFELCTIVLSITGTAMRRSTAKPSALM
jgi:hypothetical protein